ncbi:MAG: hypothetical protein JETT_2810 [Candidatus Jettenia ecosi]|uniref:Uncharacterized protein n=1 Tax=Candidatus Jettenia ecosi TaxID=2494326 RepID=A0A533Q8E0_9BACT|nr:MAG: hypothetical protein JETT_2810 [Candidatus Jettenia ecosi]
MYSIWQILYHLVLRITLIVYSLRIKHQKLYQEKSRSKFHSIFAAIVKKGIIKMA